MTNETPDPIAAPVRRLMEIFDGPLEGVTFPGVGLDVLQEHESIVRSCAQELEEALALVQGARAQLEEARGGMLKVAKQGLAYAQVYAAEDADLSKELGSIEMDPRPASTRKKSRRTRAAATPAKKAATPALSGELKLDEEALHAA